jgi:FtsZ-interacting cell division protein YlmF
MASKLEVPRGNLSDEFWTRGGDYLKMIVTIEYSLIIYFTIDRYQDVYQRYTRRRRDRNRRAQNRSRSRSRTRHRDDRDDRTRHRNDRNDRSREQSLLRILNNYINNRSRSSRSSRSRSRSRYRY